MAASQPRALRPRALTRESAASPTTAFNKALRGRPMPGSLHSPALKILQHKDVLTPAIMEKSLDMIRTGVSPEQGSISPAEQRRTLERIVVQLGRRRSARIAAHSAGGTAANGAAA